MFLWIQWLKHGVNGAILIARQKPITMRLAASKNRRMVMDFHDMRRKKKALGLTNKRLAEISGVPLGTVQKILSGKTKSPRLETMIALECVLLSDIALDYTYDLSAWEKEYDEAHRSEMLEANQVKETSVKNNSGDSFRNGQEDERVELINGKVYNMAAPSLEHQLITLFFSSEVLGYIEENEEKSIPGIGPIEVRLDDAVVQPDAFILSDRAKLNNDEVVGAPDLMLEVLADAVGERAKDIVTKTAKYMTAGCREYWIVDPENETVWVYDFEHDRYPLQYTLEDSVPVNIFDGSLKIDFKKMKTRLSKFFGKE